MRVRVGATSLIWTLVLCGLLLASLSPGAALAYPGPSPDTGAPAAPAPTTTTTAVAVATATSAAATATATLATPTSAASATATATATRPVATATASAPVPTAIVTTTAPASVTETPTATGTATGRGSATPRATPARTASPTATATAIISATATALVTPTTPTTPAPAPSGAPSALSGHSPVPPLSAAPASGVQPFSNIGICPPSWQCADIGSPALAGSQTLANDQWTVSGGGAAIWGTSDQFHFAWQSLAGNGSLSAQILSQTNTSYAAQAGVMFRASTDPGAPFYLVLMRASTGIAVQYRATQGGAATEAVETSIPLPVYVRAIRVGNTFTAYTSRDGATWTPIAGASATLSGLPTTMLAGLAVSSDNTGATSTATFNAVRLGGLSWNPSITAQPAALFDAPAATGLDGRVYLFGGTDGSGDSRTTYIYTPATNGWSIGASLPSTHTAGQAVTLPNGDIALLGGASGCGGSYGLPCAGGTVSKVVDVYTPSADAWNLAGHTLPTLTTARQRFAAVLYQGSLYVLGGATTSGTLASVETYNLTTYPAAWSAGPSLPLPRMGLMAAVDGRGALDVMGGFDGTDPPFHDVFRLSGGSWSTGPTLPEYDDDGAAVTGPDGKVYLMEGFSGGQFVPATQVFDPAANGGAGAWSYGAPPSSALLGNAAVVLASGQLLTLGGRGINGVTAYAAVYGPGVGLSPDGGAPGATTTLVGRDFTPGVTVTVGWGGPGGSGTGATVTAQADQTGALNVAVTAPVTVTQNDNLLTAQDTGAGYPVTTLYAGGGLSWNTALTNLPYGRTRPAAALAPDGRIAVFGGSDGGPNAFNTTQVYSPTTDGWSVGATMPISRDGAQAQPLSAGTLAGDLAVFGGGTVCFFTITCTVYSSMDAYNPTTDSWVPGGLTPMHTPRYRFASVALGGKIYAIGGWTGSGNTASMEAYDPSSNTWTTEAPFTSAVGSPPYGLEALAAAAGPDGRIYVAGGLTGTPDGKTGRPVNTVYIYTPGTNTWVMGPGLPAQASDLGATQFSATLGPGGKVYVLGGFAAIPGDYALKTGTLGLVVAYDPRSGRWQRLTPLPYAVDSMAVVATANGQLFVIGGPAAGSAGRVQIGTITEALGGSQGWHPHQSVQMSDGLSAAVDLADGHVDVQASDISLPARGPDLSVGHTWDSLAAARGDQTTAGQGWSSDLTPSMGGVVTQTVSYTDSAGTRWLFPYEGSLTATSPYTAYSTPPGRSWALTTTASLTGTTGYVLADFLTGEVWQFDGQGRLTNDTDAYGNTNALTYGSTGPTSVTNYNSGDNTPAVGSRRSLAFTYSASGLLADAQSPLWQSGGATAAGSQRITYGYTPETVRTTVDDSVQGSGPDQFTYLPAGTWLHCTTPPNGPNCDPSYYDATNSADNGTNDDATLAFTGTGITYYATLATNRGWAAVSIDGGAETLIDLYAPTTRGDVAVYTSPALAAGVHTLTIRVTGTKDASSSNTYVTVDRVDVSAPGVPQLTTLTRGAGTTDALTTTFGYSSAQLVTITTPYTSSPQFPHTWTLGYDPQGRVTSVTSPISGTPGQAGYTPAYTTGITYGMSQTVVAQGVGTTGAETTTYTLDAPGEATATQDGDGNTRTTSYDTDHDPLSTTDANGNVTSDAYLYAGATGSTGLVTQTVKPALISYLAPGNTSDPVTMTNVYDPHTYDLIETDQPEGGLTLYGYDGAHSVITTTDLVSTQTPGCAQLQAQQGTHPLAPQVLGCHYVFAWRASVQHYDAYGERIASIDGRGVPVGNTASFTSADPHDSLPTVVFSPTLAAPYTHSDGYDPQGDQISASTPPITTTLNGVTTTNMPVTTTYGYDGDGNQTSMLSANGNTTTYGYDHLGRQTSTMGPPVAIATDPGPATLGYGTIGATEDSDDANDMTASRVVMGNQSKHVVTLSAYVGAIDPDPAHDRYQVALYADSGGSPGTLVASSVTGQLVGNAWNTLPLNADLSANTAYWLVYNTNGSNASDNNLVYDTAGSNVGAYASQPFGTWPSSFGSASLGPWQYSLYVTFGRSPVQTTGYDGDGNVVREQDANGDVTTHSYDPLQREVATVDPVNGTTVMTYSATEIVAQQDPQGDATRNSYDAAGRLVSATDALTGVVSYAYDPAGNTLVTTATDTSGTVASVDQRAYDAQDEVISETVSGPTSPALTTQTSYDRDGNIAQVEQPQGDTTRYTYYATDQPNIEYIYPHPVTAPGPNDPSYVRDLLDAAGNVVQESDADNRTTTTTLDGDTRTVSQATSDLAGDTTTTTSQYDPDGNVPRQTEQTQVGGGPLQTSVTTGTVDAADQVTNENADGLATGYRYDAADQQTAQTILGGAPVTTTLDAEGRPTAIGESAASTTPYTSSFGYDRNDHPVTATLPGGVQDQMGYDRDGRLVHLGLSGPGASGITTTLSSSYDYGYAPGTGWTTQVITGANGISGTETITHDARGRITADTRPGAGTESWSYDKNGNLTSNVELIEGQVRTTTYTYSTDLPGGTPIPNELASQHTDGFGTEYYQYDSHGNTTSITSTDPVTDSHYVNTHLSYDSLGRLAGVTLKDNQSVALGYNADGLRATYTVTDSTGQATTYHFGYRNGELGQVAVTGQQVYTDTYLYNPGGQPLELLRQQPDGTINRYWYVLDGWGSVVALTDSSGKVVDRYSYDVWGEIERSSEQVPQQLRYRGYWFDSALGWYWLTVRAYDPEGRFLQPDPSQMDGARTYVYVNDDPADDADPLGLDLETDLFGTCNQPWDWIGNELGCAARQVVDDFKAVLSPKTPWWEKVLIVVSYVPAGRAARAGLEARLVLLKGWAEIRLAPRQFAILRRYVRVVWRTVSRLAPACETCFAAGTQVATPHGPHAIQTLRMGDTVLSENPSSGTVQAEPVQAVITDPVSPLVAVQLSDGSAITATANHPFWVDLGDGPRDGTNVGGWVEAGQLEPGDHLRAATGREVVVTGVKQHAGSAPVYTLTIARDHTFFVGSARVLVHNASGLCNVLTGAAAERYLRYITGGRQTRLLSQVGGKLEVRIVDSLTESGVAYESKRGRIGLDSFIRKEVEKDVYLRNSGQVKHVVWVFFKSQKTGIGPTRGLKKLLQANGIDYIELNNPPRPYLLGP